MTERRAPDWYYALAAAMLHNVDLVSGRERFRLFPEDELDEGLWVAMVDNLWSAARGEARESGKLYGIKRSPDRNEVYDPYVSPAGVVVAPTQTDGETVGLTVAAGNGPSGAGDKPWSVEVEFESGTGYTNEHATEDAARNDFRATEARGDAVVTLRHRGEDVITSTPSWWLERLCAEAGDYIPDDADSGCGGVVVAVDPPSLRPEDVEHDGEPESLAKEIDSVEPIEPKGGR